MQKSIMYMGFVMGSVMVIMGFALLFFPPDASNNDNFPTHYLAVIIIPYGAFRVWRAWKTYQQFNRKQDSNSQPPQ